jgi:RNA recognition motif-containing protein
VDCIAVKRYGRSAGYGFITFETEVAADKAVELKDTELEGRKVNVERATPRDENAPRRQRRGRGGRTRGRGTRTRHEPSGELSKTTMFVGNLPFNVIDQDLINIFGDYQVEEAHVIRHFNGASRGFGFVTLACEKELQKAIEAMTEVFCDDRKLVVRQAYEDDHKKKPAMEHEIVIKTEASA